MVNVRAQLQKEKESLKKMAREVRESEMIRVSERQSEPESLQRKSKSKGKSKSSFLRLFNFTDSHGKREADAEAA